MSIHLDMSKSHRIIAAASHYYQHPTETLYLDRTLPFHDIVYLRSGSWLFTENEIDYPMEKGDILLLSAGRRHYTRLPSAPETRTICIHVSCEPGDGTESDTTIELPTLIRAGETGKVLERLEEIVTSFWSKTPYNDLKMSSLLNLILCDLNARNISEAQEAERSGSVILMRDIKRIIHEAPHRFLHLEDIASQLYVSKRSVQNAIRKHCGLSFTAYQMNHKLEMVALQLRMEPYVSLKEIASNYGFCDEFYMSNVFKKKYNLSPSEYRSLYAAISE